LEWSSAEVILGNEVEIAALDELAVTMGDKYVEVI
jgi:hypothetical protein